MKGIENYINKDKTTAYERLKITNSRLCYLLLDFKDKNQELFFNEVGKHSLHDCDEFEIHKACCLYAKQRYKLNTIDELLAFGTDNPELPDYIYPNKEAAHQIAESGLTAKEFAEIASKMTKEFHS